MIQNNLTAIILQRLSCLEHTDCIKEKLQLLSEVKNLPKFDTPFISEIEEYYNSKKERIRLEKEQQNRFNGGFDPELALQMALEQSGFEFAAAENMEMTTEKNFERKAFESCTSEELKEGEDQIRSLEKFLVDETHECSVCATDEKSYFLNILVITLFVLIA